MECVLSEKKSLESGIGWWEFGRWRAALPDVEEDLVASCKSEGFCHPPRGRFRNSARVEAI